MELPEIIIRGYASMGGTSALFFLINYLVKGGRFWRNREAIKDYLTVFALWPLFWMASFTNFVESQAKKMQEKYRGD